ncbi:MAG: 50S ribosomal protein L21 [Alphaproteobacteria bacterium]|nr:50S ribosomal protein L21 [Alphaproteobacteria bacterium]
MSSYAIIKTGGKQYRVMAGDLLRVDRLPQNKGDKISFDEVLMLSNDGKTSIGTPHVTGAKVSAEIIEQGHLPTIRIFKKKRRHNYRRNNGARPLASLIKITALS